MAQRANTPILVAHLAAWVIYVLLYATLWRLTPDFREAFIHQLWLLPPKLFLVYFALWWLVPQFLLQRKYGAFVGGLVLLSLSGGIINQLYLFYVVPPTIPLIEQGEVFWDVGRITKRLTYLNSPLLFALTAEGIRLWYHQREINARLIQEKLQAELALLKNQLQPHFFFNTLNNLYSLAMQKSDLAPVLILKLSEMMRYILYESRNDVVPLKNEIKFIESYLEIEQVRYAGKVTVETTWPGDVQHDSIPPLILFTFVENAFKHGVANELSEARIQIVLSTDKERLSYTVRNSKPMFKDAEAPRSAPGIGLQNARERLQITYGAGFGFSFQETEELFEASLTLKRRS